MIGRMLSCALALGIALFWGGSLNDLQAAGGTIQGTVTGPQGTLEGAYVGAHPEGKTITHYVMTDRSGQYSFPDLLAGAYDVFTDIPGFRTVHKEGVSVKDGSEAVADFQVEVETDMKQLVEHATNSELVESFPGTRQQKEGYVQRCEGCHGSYYMAKNRFSRKDWGTIVSLMKDDRITSIGSNVGLRLPGMREEEDDTGALREESYGGEHGVPLSDDDSISDYLASFRGPNSPELKIQFFPRATGEITRARVTEYQMPRPLAVLHDILKDPNSHYIWVNDWRENLLGRLDPNTGEIQEYPVPGTHMPGGFLSMLWDHEGYLWAAQLWSGRVVKFDVKEGKFLGAWAVPLQPSRSGTAGVCSHFAHPEGPVWVSDALRGKFWKLDPGTGEFAELPWPGSRFKCDSEGNIWRLNSRRGAVLKIDPKTNKITEYKAPTSGADPHRFTLDGDENIWYGDWDKARISYLDRKTGKIVEFPARTPWSRVYNAVGDSKRKVGYAVPHVSDMMLRADAKTGRVTEYPLPSRGHAVRNVDIDMSTEPPTLWFINQRHGRIVRFQEY